MELTINSRFLILSLIACCLIYVTSAEANDSENCSDSDSGSGSGSGSGIDKKDVTSTMCTVVTSNVSTVHTSSSLNMPVTLSTLSMSTPQYFSSTIVATSTSIEDTDFILLHTPYIYIWPQVLLACILMCCFLCGICIHLYIKNRRKRRTYIFKSKFYYESIYVLYGMLSFIRCYDNDTFTNLINY